MDETIRDYIKRRVRVCFGIAIVGWLTVALTTALWRSSGVPWVPMVGMALFGGAILAMQFFVRCPKCNTKIGQTIAMPVGLSFGSRAKVNFCPYCGVNLDTPLQDSANPIR